MKSAEDWDAELCARAPRMDTSESRQEIIRDIQRDALQSAADEVSQQDRDGRDWVSGSFWDTLVRETSYRILRLMPRSGVKDNA